MHTKICKIIKPVSYCNSFGIYLGQKAPSGVKRAPFYPLELEEEAHRGNASVDGLLRKCKMYGFVAMTYMLSDVIPVIEKLNLTFKKE